MVYVGEKSGEGGGVAGERGGGGGGGRREGGREIERRNHTKH